MTEALTKAQERGAEARDPTSDAAYFASIWQLSNYQLKQLEDAFRASQASAVKAAGLTTQPLVPDEGAIDTADAASAASADIMPSEATRAKELAGLIERVEKATGPDREIDVLLRAILVDHREVFERDTWVLGRNRRPPHDECVLGRIDPGRVARNFSPAYHKPEQPAYTASIDAALALVERLLPGIFWVIGQGKTNSVEKLFGCQLLFGTEEIIGSGESDHAPLAILLALLKALQESHDAE